MKKIFLLLFVGLFGLNLSAQTAETNQSDKSNSAFTEKAVRYGIRAGMNLSKLDCAVSLDNHIGVNAGLAAEIPLKSNIYAEASLLYSLKGAKYKESYEGESETHTYILYYLEIPIHFGIKYPLQDEISLLVDVGPYLAYSIAGVVNYEYKETSNSSNNKSGSYKLDGKECDEELNSLEWGLGFKVGAEFNQKYKIMFGYDWGQSDVFKDFEVKTRNRNLHIDLIYMF